ncbi:MAG: hypothetical protein PVF68_16205, partial [Acidobacteriota bacterium]
EEPAAPVDPDPERIRAEETAAFLASADRLIRDRNYDSKTTDHYRVQTDDPRADPVAAAALLEGFRTYFAGFWAGKTELAPEESTSRVFLFYSYFKYNQLLTGRKRFDDFRSAGHYRPYYDVIVVHTDSMGGNVLGDTLIHEAAHQLIGRRLYRGNEESLWVSEGLAAYFGYTLQGADGSFRPGALGGKSAVLIRDAVRPAGSAATARLDDYRRKLQRGEVESLEDLVNITSPERFYGEGVEDRYTAAWLLVHYLLHGEAGGLTNGFVTYLREDAAGRGGGARFFTALGREPGQLDAGFRAYVKALKKRPAPNRDG